MRLPTPARAATAAGILLATSVLLLVGDLVVVQVAGDEAHVIPFFVQSENATAAGMRVTNAGSHDTIRAYEMFANSACGYAHRDVVLALTNGTTPGRWSIAPNDHRVAGNVTFYVVESTHTPDLLRGRDVPTYREARRAGSVPGFDIVAANGTWIRIVHVNCQGDGKVDVERGPHPGTNIRFAFDSSEPWLSELPVNQGVDFLYLARAGEQGDNETYAALAQDLRRGGEFWTYSMRQATVFDDIGVAPDRILRAGFVVTLAGAIAFLALALRRQDLPAPPPPTDAAWAVAAAGEGHLLRLRRTWGLVGALLVPLLAAATYVLFNVDLAAPAPDWPISVGVAILVLDVAVLALWGLAWRRAHRDLVAWRAAWTRLDATGLDGL